MNINYKELIRTYNDYLDSTEASAVYLIKSYFKQVNLSNKWIDIVCSESYNHRSEKPAFNFIIIEIFDKKKFPVYPNKLDKQTQYDYIQICRAITWLDSHLDIETQRGNGITGSKYLVLISIYNKNHNKKEFIDQPFWNEEYGGFDYTGKVPTTTKRVEKLLDPEWDYKVRDFKQVSGIDIERIQKYFHLYISPMIIEEHTNKIEWYFTEYEKKVII